MIELDEALMESVPMVDQLIAALRGLELGDLPGRPYGPTFQQELDEDRRLGLYCGYCNRGECICYCPECGRRDCTRH